MLTWDDPNDSSITKYQYVLNGGSHWSNIPESGPGGANAVSYTATDFYECRVWTFQIRAVNPHGASPVSDAASISTTLCPPGKPTGLTVTRSPGKATLTWDDPNDPSITRYRYSVGGRSADIPGSGPRTTSYTVTGLDDCKLYWFQIYAVNEVGNGGLSDDVRALATGACPQPPFLLDAVWSDDGIWLYWSVPHDGITGYQYRQKEQDGEFGDWTDIRPHNRRYTVTSVTVGKTYVFQVRTVTASGTSSPSESVTSRLPPLPGNPTGLTAVGGNGQATLSWDDPFDGTLTKYQYRQKEGDGTFGGWTDIPGSGPDTTSYTVTGLTNCRAYAFQVRAVNFSGNGRTSINNATATPTAPGTCP